MASTRPGPRPDATPTGRAKASETVYAPSPADPTRDRPVSASSSPVRSRPRTPTADRPDAGNTGDARSDRGSSSPRPPPTDERSRALNLKRATGRRDCCVDSTATEQGTWITDARHTGHGHRAAAQSVDTDTRRALGAARKGRPPRVLPLRAPGGCVATRGGCVRRHTGRGRAAVASRAERQRADGKRPRHGHVRAGGRRGGGVAACAYLVGMLSPRRAAVVLVGVASAAPVVSATARSQLPSPPRRRLAARLATGRATHAPSSRLAPGAERTAHATASATHPTATRAPAVVVHPAAARSDEVPSAVCRRRVTPHEAMRCRVPFTV